MNRTRNALALILAVLLFATPAVAHDLGGRPHEHAESAGNVPSAATSLLGPLLVLGSIGALLGVSRLRRRSLERLRTA